MPKQLRPTMSLLCIVVIAFPACSPNSNSDDSVEKTNSAESSKTLTIINWNVLYGFNHGRSIEAGSKWLSEQSPDVVALQELNGNTASSLEKMAASWGHNFSAILKENGFPVGLTSTAPIEVIERQVEGFHHGYLHCKTQGIHFFVVHFWPNKDHEAAAILEKIQPLLEANQHVVVLGDFNTNSKKDAEYLANSKSIQPLYDVVNNFESNGFVDLVHKHDPFAKFSFPSPITIPKWSASMDVLKTKRQRIDFVFADQELANDVDSATILTSSELDGISDHYPVVVELTR